MSDIKTLLSVMDQAFKGPAWHGTPLWGSLRGVTAEVALRRPAPGRHNIWELALHTAYWKCAVRRRLTRDDSVAFPRSGSEWPPLPPVPTEAAWQADKALLRQEHMLLREVVSRFPAGRLGQKAWRSRYTNRATIEGVASHDLYHCGQIQLVKKLTS